MLLQILSPLRLLSTQVRLIYSVNDIDEEKKESSSSSVFPQRSTMAVGLGILAETNPTPLNNSHRIVVKSRLLKSSKPIYSIMKSSIDLDYYCFLKTCFLCNKELGHDKEVYMYKGDQGFCSLECRNRQIYLEEMKDIEISNNKKFASMRRSRCRNNNWQQPPPILTPRELSAVVLSRQPTNI